MSIVFPNSRHFNFFTSELVNYISEGMVLIWTAMKHELFLAELRQHKCALPSKGTCFFISGGCDEASDIVASDASGHDEEKGCEDANQA